jgi:hypothetical protein
MESEQFHAAEPAAEATRGAFMGDVEAIRTELQGLLEAMRAAAKEQSERGKKRASFFTALDTGLKLAATFLAALAAVSALAEFFGSWFTAATAASAAVISGLQTTFAPASKATREDRCAIDWSEFRTQLHESLLFDVPALRTADEARALLRRQNDRWFFLVRNSYLASGKSGDGDGQPPGQVTAHSSA